jgi:S1-C subfamily serine protease
MNLKILFLSIVLCLNTSFAHTPEYSNTYHRDVNPFSNVGMKNAIRSSVQIHAFKEGKPFSFGSGNYFRSGRYRFIMTAAHVIDDADSILVVERSMDGVIATVVYRDDKTDVAILKVEKKLKHTKPVYYRKAIQNLMGEPVYYVGHPAGVTFFIEEGIYSGYHQDKLLVNVFAFPGSSGSVLFDDDGRVVGVLSAVKAELVAGIFPMYLTQLALAADVSYLEEKEIRKLLKNAK